jgi:2-oxoglutarate ferredoxin oxidoreductase subunit alpha
MCKSSGSPISLLILKTLWPVPEELIKEKAVNVRRVVVVEMNLGQYVREIERILPNKIIGFLGQMDGRLISPNQIKKALSHG